MPDKFLECIPFLTLTSGKVSLDTGELLKLAIIAIVTAVLSTYIMQEKMAVKFQALERNSQRIEEKIDRVIADIYKPHVAHEGE